MQDIIKSDAEPGVRELIRRYRRMPDGTVAEIVVVATVDDIENGGSSADREYLIADYRVKTAFTGGAVGDWIRSVELYDVSGQGGVQIGETQWRNLTTATLLATPPVISNLEPQAVSGLTNGQLVSALSPIAKEATLQQILAQLVAQFTDAGINVVRVFDAITSQATSGPIAIRHQRKQIQIYGQTTSGSGSVTLSVLVSHENDINTAMPLANRTLSLSSVIASDGMVSDAGWAYMWFSITGLTGAGAKATVLVGG